MRKGLESLGDTGELEGGTERKCKNRSEVKAKQGDDGLFEGLKCYKYL